MVSSFVWYELLTSDVVGAKAFYGALTGWETQGSSDGHEYFEWKAGDALIGGLMRLPEDAANAGMPPCWQGYVGVADIDASLASVTAEGARVHMQRHLPGVGRFAFISDPQGASLYLMQVEYEGTSAAFAPSKPGHCGWNEYHGRDGDAALGFYCKHFGWAHMRDHDMGAMGQYHLISDDGTREIGGMMTSPLPHPAWLFYFNVPDIQAAKANVEALGGSVMMGPHQVPGGLWIVQGRDPQGAVFALIAPR